MGDDCPGYVLDDRLAAELAAAQAQWAARSRLLEDYVRNQVRTDVRAQDRALAVELVTEAAGRLRVDPLLRSRAEMVAHVLELDDETTRTPELGRVDAGKLGRMHRGERLLTAAITLVLGEKIPPPTDTDRATTPRVFTP